MLTQQTPDGTAVIHHTTAVTRRALPAMAVPARSRACRTVGPLGATSQHRPVILAAAYVAFLVNQLPFGVMTTAERGTFTEDGFEISVTAVDADDPMAGGPGMPRGAPTR